MGLDNLGKGVGKTGSGSDLSLFGSAAGDAVSGQVSSALGAFGVGDSPGWLKGLSTLANGIKVGKAGGGDGASSSSGVSPMSAIGPAASAATSVVGSVVGGAGVQQRPAPQVNYNIQTTDIEPAYLASQRLEKERAAAILASK